MKKRKLSLFMITLLLGMAWLSADVNAATRYVDSAATGSRNGTSWADAWTSFSQITGLSAGDIVYISGGSKGSSKTYSVATVTPFGGAAGNSITYKIGQVAGHNGTAIFNSSGAFVTKGDVVVSGDAGDGEMHFVFGSGGRPLNSNNDNIKISYINCGIKQYGFYNNTGKNIEIGNIYFYKANGGDDFAIYLNPYPLAGATWDVNKVHHCEIYLPRSNSGMGDDGLKISGAGTSIYNNKIIGYETSYTGKQHQDGWQGLVGQYIKIYNNYWKDIANYPIFGDAYYGDFNHLWIYNNVMVITSSAIQSSDPPKGISVGPDGGSFNNLGRWPSFNGIVVANNTIVDYGKHSCITLDPYNRSKYTNSIVANNICLNGNGNIINPGVTVSNNVTSKDGSSFSRYSLLDSANKFHLVSTDTVFKDKGTNLYSYFTTDKDGVRRPQGSAWDIGAYEFNTSSTPSGDQEAINAPKNVRTIHIQ